jgi:phage shock protein A
MGLFKTLMNKVRGVADDVNESMKDPIRDGKFAIEDAEKEIAGLRISIRDAITQRKLIEKQADGYKATAKKYQTLAENAAEAGDEDNALKFLEAVSEAEEELASAKKQVKVYDNDIKVNRKYMEKHQTDIANAKRDHARLAGNIKMAETRKKLSEARGKHGNNSALSQLNDLRSAAARSSAEAEAAEELSGSELEDAEEKYADAASDSALKDRLAKLMAKKKK